MRFLVDQDVYHMTVVWLRQQGHDVVTAEELGMQRASDDALLARAKETFRLLLTRDKDFGALTFLQAQLSGGVILLRVTPTMVEDVHQELQRLLKEHREEELRGSFCVVEPRRHRIRRLPQAP
jgi:predicted nuclease of predicted toxin-antitoxin system